MTRTRYGFVSPPPPTSPTTWESVNTPLPECRRMGGNTTILLTISTTDPPSYPQLPEVDALIAAHRSDLSNLVLEQKKPYAALIRRDEIKEKLLKHYEKHNKDKVCQHTRTRLAWGPHPPQRLPLFATKHTLSLSESPSAKRPHASLLHSFTYHPTALDSGRHAGPLQRQGGGASRRGAQEVP